MLQAIQKKSEEMGSGFISKSAGTITDCSNDLKPFKAYLKVKKDIKFSKEMNLKSDNSLMLTKLISIENQVDSLDINNKAASNTDLLTENRPSPILLVQNKIADSSVLGCVQESKGQVSLLKGKLDFNPAGAIFSETAPFGEVLDPEGNLQALVQTPEMNQDMVSNAFNNTDQAEKTVQNEAVISETLSLAEKNIVLNLKPVSEERTIVREQTNINNHEENRVINFKINSSEPKQNETVPDNSLANEIKSNPIITNKTESSGLLEQMKYKAVKEKEINPDFSMNKDPFVSSEKQKGDLFDGKSANFDLSFTHVFSGKENEITLNYQRNIISQVTRSVTDMSKLEKHHFTLELYPEELGKIKVDMNLENGKIDLKITAEHESITKVLTEHLSQLKTAFNINNVDIKNIDITSNKGYEYSFSDFSGGFRQADEKNEENEYWHYQNNLTEQNNQQEKGNIYYKNNQLLNYLI